MSDGYHEDQNKLTKEVRDMHRALESMKEELEAIDWYNQRIDLCTDTELETILRHNRDEEKHHAVMLFNWIKKKDNKFV
jgi:hypothetical protein